MFHYTMFSGSETHMSTRGFTALTVFGAATLCRPTLAQRILDEQRTDPATQTWWQRVTDSDRNVVLTLFGGTTLQRPTLVEEYSALRALVTTGTLDRDEIVKRMRELLASDSESDITTITLFGAFADGRPSAKAQVKALDKAEKAGLLPRPHRRRLDDVVDASPIAGLEVIGELIPEF